MVMDNRLRRAVWGLKEKKSAMAGLEKAGLLWPDGVIPYEIDPDFPPEQRARLARIQTEFHHRTCIRYINYFIAFSLFFCFIFPLITEISNETHFVVTKHKLF